ncbi:PadR family transcriptional regulator [Ruminococcus sp. CLA-AA-H200]|uniref:PadR family transcriptional regulator n=1 Tax=Ruminococcus turbiniformis TaxID=2881258 RepID=A0ABS8FVZ4_9FIRM|nr:PadR family transcriptional regulator [Ruminococcus turbiniformis]MCC2254217.1 PadR family transcriptional regulator [Ruminococcus turbiniformis]
MFDKKQLLKGVLEGCILKIIIDRPSYGYELYTRLLEYGFEDLQMGTVYPILMRLEKKELVSASYEESAQGPVKKVYSVTASGLLYYESFLSEWNKMTLLTDRILKGESK